jgi:mitochondrial ornithine carrier protein
MNAPTKQHIATEEQKPILITRRTTLKRQRTDRVVLNSILAGSVAGIMSTSVVYPFDLIRTKMQSVGMGIKGATSNSTPFQVFQHTLKHGGIRALYTGISVPLAAQALYKATVFASNNSAKQLLKEWNTTEGGDGDYQMKLSDIFWCGFVGGGVNAALFVTPVEFVRNQLIAQHTKIANGIFMDRPVMKGPLDVVKYTLKNSGISGLWRGVGVTVARDSIGCGFFFAAMHTVQKNLSPDGPPSMSVTVLSGVSAGLSFWFSTLPLDTLKTWVQNGTTSSAKEGLVQSFKRYGATGTFQQLTRGWQMAFGRGAPSAAIMVTTYDYTHRYLSAE